MAYNISISTAGIVNGQSNSTFDHTDAETPNEHLFIKYEV